MKHLFAFVLLLLAVQSCQNQASSAQTKQQEQPASLLEQAYQQTLAVHDEIMPGLAELERLQRQLATRLDSLSDEAQKVKYRAAIDSLEAAYNGMMDWMANFRPIESLQKEGLSNEQMIEEYKKQEKEIREIGRRMEAARKLGEEL